MNSELVKAHEQTKRFQEVLGMEQRKQKSLKVRYVTIGSTCTICDCIYLECIRKRITTKAVWIW